MLRRVHRASLRASNDVRHSPEAHDLGELYRSQMTKSQVRALLGFAEDGQIEFANSAAANMFGRADGELVGLDLEDLMPLARERLVAQTREQVRTRLWSIGRRPDGSSLPIRIVVERLPPAADHNRYLAVMSSLTLGSASEPSLASLIDGGTDSAMLWDHAGRLMLWNDRALQIHGYAADLITLGTPFELFLARCAEVSCADAGERAAFIEAGLARHRTAAGVREETTINGKCLLVAERHLPDGSALRLESDITELKLRDAELRAAKEKAEAASRSKSSFLANMSHELRTPLNAVIGFADILKSQMLGPIGNEKYLEYAQHISDSGAHLLHLVNYILDLSRIEAGRYELRREPLAPGELVADVMRLMRISAEKTNIEMATSVAAELPAILVDRRAIRQVLLNILSNAIKFTPAGGRVSVAASADAHLVSIVVTDTGIGIAKEDLPRLTNPFEQAGDAYARNQGGAGLGLAITKQLIGLHGGTLEIDSALGKGTTVTVRLPIWNGIAGAEAAE